MINGTTIGEIKRGSEIGARDFRRSFLWHACVKCGKPRWVNSNKKGDAKTTVCLKRAGVGSMLERKGLLKHGEAYANAHWKGGRVARTDGYAMVYVYSTDFFFPMADKRKYVMEHRLVMAKHLNRHLLAWETVHHINGIRNDNRLENLELLPSPHQHDALSRMKQYIKKLEREVDRLHIDEL